MIEEFINLPLDIVYTSGCEASLRVVEHCRDNNIPHNVLEHRVDKKALELCHETPFNPTPMVFDSEGWIVADNHTYKRVLQKENFISAS